MQYLAVITADGGYAVNATFEFDQPSAFASQRRLALEKFQPYAAQLAKRPNLSLRIYRGRRSNGAVECVSVASLRVDKVEAQAAAPQRVKVTSSEGTFTSGTYKGYREGREEQFSLMVTDPNGGFRVFPPSDKVSYGAAMQEIAVDLLAEVIDEVDVDAISTLRVLDRGKSIDWHGTLSVNSVTVLPAAEAVEASYKVVVA